MTSATLADFDTQLAGYLTKTDKLALLLDFDGTLADLTAHPDLTELRDEVRTVLKALSEHPNVFVSIISGRAVQEVKNKVQIPNLTYGGNHGFQIEFANGVEYVHQVPLEVRLNFPKMVAALEAQVVHDGSWVEDKKASLTFHYRSMPQELRPPVLEKAREIITQFGYRCSQAHEALEAKPPVDWNKGFAAAYILDHEFGTNWKSEIKTIFAGDDTTDEDIMRVIKGVGRSYRVTRGSEVVTEADFRIHNTGDVFTLLQWLKRLFLE